MSYYIILMENSRNFSSSDFQPTMTEDIRQETNSAVAQLISSESLDEAPIELTVTTSITSLEPTPSCGTSTSLSSPTSSSTVAVQSSEDGSSLDVGAMVETESTPSPNPDAEIENESEFMQDEHMDHEQPQQTPSAPMVLPNISTSPIDFKAIVFQSDSEIKAGAKFASFADFERVFEHWKATNFHPFRVASSETLRLPDGTTNMLFRYRYIVFHCAHYGAPRMRGNGKRPNQNYMPCGCRAMLRLNYSWSENALRVTTLHEEHYGHDASEESYSRFIAKKQRQSSSSPPAVNGGSNRPTPKRSRSGSPYSTNQKYPPTKVSKNDHQSPVDIPLNLSKNGMQRGQMPPMIPDKRPMPMSGPIPPISTTLQPAPNSASALSVLMFNHQQQHQQQQTQRHAYHELMRLLSANGQPNPALMPAFAPNGIGDHRTEADRQRLAGPILQALGNHLVIARGYEFEEKLRELKVVLKKWQLLPQAPTTPVAPPPAISQTNFAPRSTSAAAAAAAMMVQAMSASAGANAFGMTNGNANFDRGTTSKTNGLISNGH